MKSIRTLIYCPVIHTTEDLGKMGEPLRKAGLENLGAAGLERKDRMVRQIWTLIESYIERLEISFDKLRLYQDGLPVCGREYDIVKHMARAGSRNHQILIRLMDKGAMLTGTEDPALLLAEYEWIKQSIHPPLDSVEKSSSHTRDRAKMLLKQRDQFIAVRINQTLEPGEYGILFIGMLHRVDPLLDPDIRIICPNLTLKRAKGV